MALKEIILGTALAIGTAACAHQAPIVECNTIFLRPTFELQCVQEDNVQECTKRIGNTIYTSIRENEDYFDTCTYMVEFAKYRTTLEDPACNGEVEIFSTNQTDPYTGRFMRVKRQTGNNAETFKVRIDPLVDVIKSKLSPE